MESYLVLELINKLIEDDRQDILTVLEQYDAWLEMVDQAVNE